MQNALENIKDILDQAEERIYEVEDRSFEIIQSEKNKEKKWKGVKIAYMNLRYH